MRKFTRGISRDLHVIHHTFNYLITIRYHIFFFKKWNSKLGTFFYFNSFQKKRMKKRIEFLFPFLDFFGCFSNRNLNEVFNKLAWASGQDRLQALPRSHLAAVQYEAFGPHTHWESPNRRKRMEKCLPIFSDSSPHTHTLVDEPATHFSSSNFWIAK